jgi:hypothetical protein
MLKSLRDARQWLNGSQGCFIRLPIPEKFCCETILRAGARNIDSKSSANAVFDAIGARLRTILFTPERVKAALGGHSS